MIKDFVDWIVDWIRGRHALFKLSRKSRPAPRLSRQHRQTMGYFSCCAFLLWIRKHGGRFDHSDLSRLSRRVVQGHVKGASGVRQVEFGDRAVREIAWLTPRFDSSNQDIERSRGTNPPWSQGKLSHLTLTTSCTRVPFNGTQRVPPTISSIAHQA